MNDVSEDLKAFLDYVSGKKTDNDFVARLEQEVMEARRNREWRHEYMTLLMRDQENLAKGRAEGRASERKELVIKMIRQGYTMKQILALVNITEKELEEYKSEM